VLAASTSQLVLAKYGQVLVDASKGPVTMTLVNPPDSFHPVVVVKVDSTANAVTVVSKGGEHISGAASDTLASQWSIAQYEADSTQWYKNAGTATTVTLGGDVTGTATANTVSKLQTVTLTIGTPNPGDVLMYDGTQITPTPTKARVLDTTYSPVGLWNINLGAGVGPKDYSGNGNDLTVETGTARYSGLLPSVGGFLFDGATTLYVSTSQAVLQLTGAMTILWLMEWSDLPAGGAFRVLTNHGAALGGTSATNTLYATAIGSSNQQTYLSHHGANVADSGSINTFAPRSQVALMGLLRDGSGNVSQWYNGTIVGTSFATVTLPTDGSSGKLRIGSDPGGVNFFTGVMSSIGLYNAALTPTQMLERYNYCLGREFGYR
jgi:hypothetical protein